MEKMKELYDKVATDSTLQSKFVEIMKEADKAGKVETEKSLLAFAKEAGYDLAVEEAAGFFAELESKTEGELSDAELDMVAGGKTFTVNTSTVNGCRGGHLL